MLASHLGNPSFPLLRYAIGDVTPEPIDRSGPGFARLSTVEGRSHDMLITRTGGVLHSMWLEDVIEHYDAIRRMAAHQAGDGSTRVELELSGSPGSLETEALARRISDCLGGYPVTVEILDRIPTSPAGKHRWMTSELGAKLVDGPASTGAPVSGR
jgi:phenylacetate-coenzyme A ligase PaaK-like adenylate-forming protein